MLLLLLVSVSVMAASGGAPGGGSVQFLALGDWGGVPDPPFVTPREVATAAAMGRAAEELGADFVLALGDNFYYEGVRDEWDPRFQDTFERAFAVPGLRSLPWFVLAGNHDHAGNVSAQIAYGQRSPRWHFPHPYYSLRLSLPGTNASARLLLLDTVLLCGGAHDFRPGRGGDSGSAPGDSGSAPRDSGSAPGDSGSAPRDSGSAPGDSGSAPRDSGSAPGDSGSGPGDSGSAPRDSAAAAAAQLAWLRRRLAGAARDRFVLVAGHYPVWSAGEHGPSACLRRSLRPLLRRHRVSAYLCGHDHNLQFLWEGGVGYVVSGAGNFMEGSQRHGGAVPPGSLRFFYGAPTSPGGFVHVRLEPDAATVTFLEATGRLLHRVVLPPRGP